MYFFRFGVGLIHLSHAARKLAERWIVVGSRRIRKLFSHPEPRRFLAAGLKSWGFCGLWEVDHLRNLWPTIARSQLLAGHEADINRPHCKVALIDRPLGPVGSFIDFTAKQVKESLCARITGRAT